MVSKEKSAKSVEKEGERYRVSLQSTTVYTGGGQLLPKGAMRKNSGVITNFPITHIFTLRRLLVLLPRRTMMAEGKGVYCRTATAPALRSDLVEARDPNALSQPCARVLHPPGSLPERAPRSGWGSATYLLESMAEAKVAGSPKSRAAPGDHLPSTPQVPPPPLPSAAATHSHHGRHRSTRVLTHFIVETTPARVE